MAEWWDSLDTLLRVLYCIAVPTGIILLFQIILTMIGFGQGGAGVNPDDISGLDSVGDGVDLDIDMPVDSNTDTGSGNLGDGGIPGDFGALHLFTLEGVMAFLTVFSWTAILVYRSGAEGTVSVLTGAVLGVIAMYGVAKIIQLTSRLAHNGTLRIRNALGQTATVYLTVPAQGSGQGKVNLTVQGRYIEASAITDGTENISTGTIVRVVDVRADDVLVVEREQEMGENPPSQGSGV